MAQSRLAIVFDFGGVLFDWNPHYLYGKLFNGDLQAVDRFLAEIGFSSWNAEQDKGRTFAEAVVELSGRFPHYADLIRAYDERYEESLAGAIQPTVDLLVPLKQAGYPLYGLTNWPAEKYDIVRPKHAFLELFDDIVVSGKVKLAKPDPRIFTLLLERTGRSAGDCLYIDDSLENTHVAQSLGFQTIHFQSAAQLKQDLTHRGIL